MKLSKVRQLASKPVVNLSMSVNIYPAADRKQIAWAGGTSTEIYIFPSDGDFASRNFDFRISTATVEVEESDFTYFEGITRHLMILEGTLELTHVNRYHRKLERFDQDTFSGEWSTRSRGKVTDFNLMLKNGYTGSLKHEKVGSGEQLALKPASNHNFVFVAEGEILTGSSTAESGALIQYRMPFTIVAKSEANLILVTVNAE